MSLIFNCAKDFEMCREGYTCDLIPMFLLASRLMNDITIEFMFAGINMFWARLRLILARAAITINITLESTEKTKTEKNDNKTIFFFTSAVRKRQQILKWLLDFDWLLRSYDYLILIFYWFISAG